METFQLMKNIFIKEHSLKYAVTLFHLPHSSGHFAFPCYFLQINLCTFHSIYCCFNCRFFLFSNCRLVHSHSRDTENSIHLINELCFSTIFISQKLTTNPDFGMLLLCNIILIHRFIEK